MTKRRLAPGTMPTWLANLPRDARVTHCELAKLLGYTSTHSFDSSISAGLWPEVKDMAQKHPERWANRVYYPAYKVRNLIRNLIKENAND